jgi:C1A family cysteine protease
MMVYSSMESEEVSKSGRVPMPQPNEECLGGHAVLMVGFDDKKKTVLVRNSWGDKWGMGGYFTLPYDYITNPHLTSDFWVLSKIDDNHPTIHKTVLSQLSNFF